jgi:hypothetical protein
VARCAPAAATVQFWGLIYFWHQPVTRPGIRDR